MKNFKRILICLFAMVSTFMLCSAQKSPEAESQAAVLNDNAFNYMTLSQSGQVIDSSKLTTIDNSTYIITNNSVTITLKPLQYRYRINADLNNFFKYTQTITVEQGDDGDFPNNFEFQGRTYYYLIAGSVINIYNNQISGTSVPVVTSATTDLISYNDVDDVREIYITTSYTSTQDGFVDSLGYSAKYANFQFTVGTSSYSLNIQEPVVNFYNLTEPIVMFNTFKTDDYGAQYPAEKSLAPNQILNKLQITFLNNNYTEGNPLYFNINFNGFIYDYTLFSKEIGGENLLFVNYSNEDANFNYNNSSFLASSTTISTNAGGEETIVANKKIYAENGGSANEFSLIFNKTGRYSIEFYDSTYVQGMTNANYYSTSFFIREEGEEISPFQNIYIVAEILDDENNHLDYIVSDSVLNNISRITVKNLGDFGKDASGNDITLADVVESISVLTTDFGIDRVETVTKTYTVDEILAQLQNNDFILNFTEDAYYQIIIKPKNKEGETPLPQIKYIFTIVRNAKTTFTFKNEVYEANVLYKTDVRNYTNPINSSIDLNIKFSTSEESTINLKKTYVNTFNIKYGVKAVLIEKYTPKTKDDEKVPVGLYLKVYGVGDISVYINGKLQEKKLNSEKGDNTIDLLGYGKYTIRIVDSMGTESKTMTFNIKKGLNTSAMILIVLSLIIATVIVVFILRARGKIATR